MHMKKRSIISLITLALTTVCAFTVATVNKDKPVSETKALTEPNGKSYPYVDPALPLSDEDNLYVSLDNITKTSSGESFTFSFGANTILFPVGTTGTNKYKEVTGVYVTPMDDNYPKDKKLSELTKYDVDINNYEKDENVERDADGNIIYEDDGRPKLKEGHGFSYERPTYTAYVSIIDTANFKKKNIDTVVIPYSITYGSWYTLLVSGISEDCIYNETVNSYQDKYGPLKNVIIGDNIENISENAFHDCPSDFVISTPLESKPAGWSDEFTESSINYGYEPSKHELEIFDQSEKKDEAGNIIYYDNTGAVVDEEGYYLDESGSRIIIVDPDGNITYKRYDGTPVTTYAAQRFSAGNYKSLAAEKSFIVGYVSEEEGVDLPLLIKYFVKLPDGTSDERIFECPLSNPSMFNYDAVGSMAGMYAMNKVVDIRLNEGEDIDYTTIRFYNIFEAKLDETSSVYKVIPDLNHAYQGVPSISLSRKNNFSDFFTAKFSSIKTVFGYTSISLILDCVDGAYALVKEKKYHEKEQGILDGTYKIRYSLRGFKASSFNITTKNDEFTNIKFNNCTSGGIPGELDYYVMTKKSGNEITFLLQDKCIGGSFNANNMKKVEICGFNVTLDICPTKKGTTQVLSQSSVTFRFGFLDLLPEDTSNISAFDCNLFIILYFVGFVALYALGTLGYYFYAKHAYKNDEFRRMNGKAYLKRISVGFIGALFIVGAIAFIILRFNLVSPTIAVFNPMDPLVIVFGVGAIISIGFFIKFLVVYIKQEKTRRKNIKLRLGEEAAEDGTK